VATETLERLLDSLTIEGELYERLPDQAVRCYACRHRCLIREGTLPSFGRGTMSQLQSGHCRHLASAG